MIDIITKSRLPNYFYNQFIPSFMVLIFGLLLGYKKYSPLLIMISITILYYYSYFIHRLFHNFPKFMNIHMKFHHNKNNKNIVMKYINLLIELITNIMFFVIFYFVQKLFFTNFVPEIYIFYYGFIYVSVHIINYSLFHAAPEHIIHHDSCDSAKVYNYGPDLIDHIFNTNYSKNFENYNHIIPNILMSFLLTYYFYKPKIL